MKRLQIIFATLAVLFFLGAAPVALAQTIPDAAYEEAIGRIWYEGRFGQNPGTAFGPSGVADWPTEFLYRRTGKQVRDRAALIAASQPASDRCIFRIFGAENYLRRQREIFEECARTAATPSGTGTGEYVRGFNDAVALVVVPPRK